MRTWKVDDVMTKAVVSVKETASYRSVVDLLTINRFSAVPVVDDFARVLGVVSEADLLRKIEYAGDENPRMFESRRRRGERTKALAGNAHDLMSTPAVVVLSGTTLAAAARLMDRESVKRLPVIDDLGRLIGVVSRGDLLKVHLRPDDDIQQDVTASVPPAVTVEVTDGVVTLTGRLDRFTAADEAARRARQVAGVAEVVDKLAWDVDDSSGIVPGSIFY
ncbi:CBS domain-containing protein [Paractinoplanes durhamensis]|uniref:CBS domain-containing protein n=1 Tax=Paractinoplanes durhamensis TaxID=113563 RepID=A0ABQ3YUT1_9ACTN|nr:CBS domain-containing protein [Actinoplanes durhamensis]GIE01350.1 hypothetical protein Adu01nite_27000 [Actinoplanes durhamensis]